MAAAPEVIAAFQAGSGLSATTSHDVMVVVLAAVVLIWLAWAVSGVGQKVLDRRMTYHEAAWYSARAVVLAMLVVFYLVR
ncbi:MAG: TIGR03758 family integrating conjugative element protein [Burkholderiales bacterium]|nr:TIGR03758 family integrating conjugative element protein [Burkholderiales bacterium]